MRQINWNRKNNSFRLKMFFDEHPHACLYDHKETATERDQKVVPWWPKQFRWRNIATYIFGKLIR